VTTPTHLPVFDHLLHMTDRRGTVEQALLAEPAPEHGYCTADMARVLVVVSREPDPERTLNGIGGLALRFLNEAQALNGACRNRMDGAGKWVDDPALDDSWGKCIWGLGTAAAHSAVAWVRQSAIIQFERAAQRRSTSPRAMAFAALGAAELLKTDPGHVEARELLTHYAQSVSAPSEHPAWLVDYETVDGHFSPTPLAGRGAADARPGFEQQPIEVSSLADACARAAAADPSPVWPDGVRRAAAWFDGDNDAGLAMWDAQTGGGFDGLHADGVNHNQGTESTLAALSTMQHARHMSAVGQ